MGNSFNSETDIIINATNTQLNLNYCGKPEHCESAIRKLVFLKIMKTRILGALLNVLALLVECLLLETWFPYWTQVLQLQNHC